MYQFLTWLAVFFFAAPFFIWGCCSFYLRTKRRVVYKYGWKIFGMIMLGILLGVLTIILMVFCL
ncbi:hypothetical protein CG006_01510 [Mesoplasma florum]|uniref:hypothetical protein n=1 Tax=Mesoplasma florum TaxID=2151 RepID=UPI000D03E977|nr:hypothetical protein [Mesoplasma florum]AVN58900.1 hypothetical protein CG009_01505 [Mesoplasma florum]AVN63655.1 hypothetical protein CG006_01510 [Mesoplasma florum]